MVVEKCPVETITTGRSQVTRLGELGERKQPGEIGPSLKLRLLCVFGSYSHVNLLRFPVSVLFSCSCMLVTLIGEV